MKRTLFAFALMVALCGAAVAAPVGKTVQRPISDFLDNQSISFSNMWNGPTVNGAMQLAYMDYTGRMAQELKDHAGIDLHTIIEGTVHERPLPDGRAEVTVELHAKNVLTNVQVVHFDEDGNFAEILPEMGVTWGDVLNFYGFPWQDYLEGNLPYHEFPFALGECFFKWVSINPKPGALIPDMGRIVFSGEYPDVKPVFLQFEGRATGPLWEEAGLGPDGTPGNTTIQFVNFMDRGNVDDNPFYMGPVYNVDLRRFGR